MSQHGSRRSLLSLGLPADVLANLTRNGYETVQDLNSTNAEDLSKTLSIPFKEVQALYARYQKPSISVASHSMTQSAANMVKNTQKMLTKCGPLDDILHGGLARGDILELSGPPGSPKERMAVNILLSFVKAGEDAIFVDCLNMTSPSILAQALDSTALQERVHYTSAQTLLDFLTFIHHLPALIASHPQVSLVVLNSISAPFQTATLDIKQRNFHLEKVRQTLTRVVASKAITVVTTSQLSSRGLNVDGTFGSFDSGARVVMVPSLGPSYLPSSRAHRVILAPDGMLSGLMRLLSSPKYPPGKAPSRTIAYCIGSS